MTYKIEHNKDQNKDYLVMNNKPAICPFRNASHQLVHNNLGATGVMSQWPNCDSNCPFWDLADEKDSLILHCSSSKRILPIEK